MLKCYGGGMSYERKMFKVDRNNVSVNFNVGYSSVRRRMLSGGDKETTSIDFLFE